jgi:hypothetical protein
MELLWQYLKPHRKLVFFSLFLAAVAQLASLATPEGSSSLAPITSPGPNILKKPLILAGMGGGEAAVARHYLFTKGQN